MAQLIDLRDLSPTDLSRCFYSAGAVCQHLQITPAQLRVCMEDSSVRFVQIIDATAYLDGNGFQAVAAKAAEVRNEIASVRAAVPNN
jgi:hypothetical protein